MCEIYAAKPTGKIQKEMAKPKPAVGVRNGTAVGARRAFGAPGGPPGVGRVEVCWLPRCGDHHNGEKTVSAQTQAWRARGKARKTWQP